MEEPAGPVWVPWVVYHFQKACVPEMVPGGGPISGTQEPENEEPCPAWAVSYLRITCVPEMGGAAGGGAISGTHEPGK